MEPAKGIRRSNLQKIKALGKPADKFLHLYGHVEENLVLTINRVAETPNISYNMSAKNVEMLRELKILRKTNMQPRNRIYGVIFPVAPNLSAMRDVYLQFILCAIRTTNLPLVCF